MLTSLCAMGCAAALALAATGAGSSASRVAGSGPMAQDAPASQVRPLADAPIVTAVSPRDARGRPLADVMVNGQGPFRFVVDTGANRSVVSRDLADKLGLERIGVSEVNGVNGVAKREIARTARIDAGALTIANLETPVLETQVLGGADGLLGTEGLAGKRILFDNVNKKLVIGRGSPYGAPPGFSIVPLKLKFGRLAMAEAQIGKVKFKAVIDTGAEAAVANTALIRALIKANETVDPQLQVTVMGATNAESLARWTILPNMRMGGMDIVMVETAVADLHVFDLWELSDEPAMIVGMNILRQTEAFAIDYRARQLQVKFLEWTNSVEFTRLRTGLAGSTPP